MKRILLKLSGGFFRDGEVLWSIDKLQSIANQLKTLLQDSLQIAIVIGGGNIFRGGRNDYRLDRTQADAIGMSATCINALFLQSFLQTEGIETVLYGTFLTGGAINPFCPVQVQKQLEQGRVVILSGGTGHAFFSTDTAAALRALEIHADALFKATTVDGVYAKPPDQFPDAKRFDHLTYDEVLEGRYGVMDACAFALCQEQKLPLFIFNAGKPDSIVKAVRGQIIGTWIGDKNLYHSNIY